MNICLIFCIYFQEFSVNNNELFMIKSYIYSFNIGFIQVYKDGFRFWIRDKGFIVETQVNIVFCDEFFKGSFFIVGIGCLEEISYVFIKCQRI